jgi:hypothetical protein
MGRKRFYFVKVSRLDFRGTISPQDKERSDFLLIPLDVPPGVKSIVIEYSYRAKDTGECEIDIGLFSPGRVDFPAEPEAFRGWSGTAKKKIVVGERYATPGYLPGEVKPGTWHIVLGLYKVPSCGCDYTVSVDMRGFEEEFAHRRTTSTLAPSGGPRWYKGDLHTHSVHSDGDAEVWEIAEKAREKGLDFVALTDHNTISHVWECLEIGGPAKIFPGMEITTYYGHMNLFGVRKWIDFRARTESDMAKIIELAEKYGYIASINHPKPDYPWLLGNWEKVRVMETWQTVWEYFNYLSLRKYVELLSSGRNVVAIGGSDAHKIRHEEGIPRLGEPTTLLYMESLTEEAFLDAIRQGRVVITSGPNGPLLEYEAEGNGKKAGIKTTRIIPRADKLRVKVEEGNSSLFIVLTARGPIKVGPIEDNLYTKDIPMVLTTEDVFALPLLMDPDYPTDDPLSEEAVVKAMANPILLKETR